MKPEAHRRLAGLYAVTPEAGDTAMLARLVHQALQGGARMVQFRSKHGAPDDRVAQATALAALCRDFNALFIVNDDTELALSVGADGVHLGRSDMDLAAARRLLGPARVIGASCYNDFARAVAARAAGADYVAFGSAFPSATKPDAVHAPLQLFVRARRELQLPVAAIGGITPANAPPLLEAGAHMLAVINALFSAADVTESARAFSTLFKETHVREKSGAV